MSERPFKRFLLHLFVLIFLAGSLSDSQAFSRRQDLNRSVVKIYVTLQFPDYTLPWQSGHAVGGSGSGFIIGNKRILTNAHIVSNARFIQVQKDGNPQRFQASVEFVGHDCDLAVLLVDDPSFFEGTKPVVFARELPRLNDEVTVIGYPMGGARLSMTKGIVSRIDYSVYTHSSVDLHLVLQVDAAINPGNSGGPVMFKGKIVGLAFQVLTWAENIGYAIPVPVIDRFLKDIEDGVYNRYPELGAQYLDLQNTALRSDLNLPQDETGVVVYFIDPFGSANGLLHGRDVLLSIDSYEIANDGTVVLDGNTVVFSELLERKQWGDSVVFTVWRAGAEVVVEVPLRNPADPFLYRNVYDKVPEYYMFGGLVFSPLTREYLKTVESSQMDKNVQQLVYYSHYSKVEGLYQDRDEFVVMIRRLPHAINTYADAFVNGVVDEVNGVKIRKLEDVKRGMGLSEGGFHVIRFAGMDDSLVLDAEQAEKANSEILERYGLPASEFFEGD
jgi:S1-C subfamily serine protease